MIILFILSRDDNIIYIKYIETIILFIFSRDDNNIIGIEKQEVT